MNKNPRVTILMPVYNGEKYLREAIDSMLQQTFTDFEFLIINDGSTDRSVKIIESYEDERIRLVHNEKNLKLIATLNKGLDLARGEYIARMDCDDISLRKRLEKQVAFMDENLTVGICGTWVETIGEVEGVVWKYHQDSNYLRCQLFFDSPLAHPSVMLRAKKLKEYQLVYNREYIHIEDWFLWQTAAKYFRLANIPEILLHYRIWRNSVSKKNEEKQQESIKSLHSKNIKELKINCSEKELKLQYTIGQWGYEGNLLDYYKWLKKIIIANRKEKIYPLLEFERVVKDRWSFICGKNSGFGFKIFFRVLFSDNILLNLYIQLSKKQIINLIKVNIRKG